MKKLVSIAGSVALLASSLAPAFGANTCVNSTTGPFSDNVCSIKNNSSVNVENVNDAVVVNEVRGVANSGGNETSYNTLGGMITTGDARLNSAVSTVANVNTTYVTGVPSASSNTGVNEITGPESSNVIWIENQHRVDVYNSNTATVDNDVDAMANSGENRANYNTGPASVTAGNADLVLSVGTHVNDNLTEVAAEGDGGGGNYAENSTTGPFSLNTVSMKNNSFVTVENVNDMIVENDVRALANSGRNKAKWNTLGGEIVAGDAVAGVGVDTEGNFNTTRIAMAMGGFSNEGVNSVTGPAGGEGDPQIWIENTQRIDVENYNNKCRSHNADRLGDYMCDPADLGVFNLVDALADTGTNDANYNTGGGGVLAGMADLMQQVLVHMNDTLTEIQY